MFERVSIVVACFAAGLTLFLGWITVPGLARSLDGQVGVIISEVAWQGTVASDRHEWIELYNSASHPIDLNGWNLTDGGDIDISLTGTIPTKGFHLLERSEESISNIDADQFYIGVLRDSGESLELRDDDHTIVDSANEDGGSWPAGSNSPDVRSMERRTPFGGISDTTWISNDTYTRNGLDADLVPINGTPGQANSSWTVAPLEADLSLSKTGPLTGTAGEQIHYALTVGNVGGATVTDVVLTDMLPSGLIFSEDNGLHPLQQPEPGMLIWQLGTITPGHQITILLTTTVNYGVEGAVDNFASLTAPITETHLHNNQAQTTTIVDPNVKATVIIKAVHFSGYEGNQPDEAFQLINVGSSTADIAGWSVSDNEGRASFPDGALIYPGQQIWVAREAKFFTRQFGFNPAYEITGTDPNVPNLIGSAPRFADDGDEVLIYDATDFLSDALVYLKGNTSQSGWSGPAVEPYVLSTIFGANGQILYRLNDEYDGWPVADTNTAADWAQSNSDSFLGKRVQYPGWDLDAFFFSQSISESVDLSVGVAPDNALELIIQEIRGAKSSIEVESLTFRSWPIALELIAAAERGVRVTVLLEGDPPTGIDDQEKYNCQQLQAAGGTCWFMISNSDENVYDRYRYLHAKFIIIDQQRVIISTENLSPDSLPNDDKGNGTWGRRGLVLGTNSPGVVDQIRDIWLVDFDPANHLDLFKWQAADPAYGNPPPGTVPIIETGRSGYNIRYPSPWQLIGSMAIEVIQSPENSLRSTDGILHLINTAGQGDTILVQQLSERPHWGPSNSNSIDDPNPRLEAMVAASRRGAAVRLLLDDYFGGFNDPVGNQATCGRVNQIAAVEKLDLRCVQANPTGLGIHNKMILVEKDDVGYSYIGSINGTELSHKGNREVALLIQSDDLYYLLAQMFHDDWPQRIYFPAIYREYVPPADYVLISELYYDPPGAAEDDEFIEIANPTKEAIHLDYYSLGDASRPEDFEDLRRFPINTIILPDTTLVIATTAAGYQDRFGSKPDFEIVETDPTVPNLVDDPSWGDPAAFLRLGNSGDEVYLRDPAGLIVDAIAYGTGKVPGVPSCPILSSSGRSLERYPYWRDTDDCPADFRDWPLPNPGSLP